MSLPPLSRKVRLTLAVVWLVLLVGLQWIAVLRWSHSPYRVETNSGAHLLGYVLLAVYFYVLVKLGFEEEITARNKVAEKLSFYTRLVIGIVVGIVIIGFPLVLILSFFTDIPFLLTAVILVVGSMYCVWKWFPVQRRSG